MPAEGTFPLLAGRRRDPSEPLCSSHHHRPALGSQHTQIVCDPFTHPSEFPMGAECLPHCKYSIFWGGKSTPRAQISPLQKSICISLGHIAEDPTYCSTGTGTKTPQKCPKPNSASPLAQAEAHTPWTVGFVPTGGEGAAAQPQMDPSPKHLPHPLFTLLTPGYKTFLLKSFQIK